MRFIHAVFRLGPVAQLDRASDYESEGCRFDSCQARHFGECQIAGWSSLVARQAHNLKVVGSNPAPATNLVRAGDADKASFLFFGRAMVKRRPAADWERRHLGGAWKGAGQWLERREAAARDGCLGRDHRDHRDNREVPESASRPGRACGLRTGQWRSTFATGQWHGAQAHPMPSPGGLGGPGGLGPPSIQ